MPTALITGAGRENSIAAEWPRLSSDGWTVCTSDLDRGDYPCDLSSAHEAQELVGRVSRITAPSTDWCSATLTAKSPGSSTPPPTASTATWLSTHAHRAPRRGVREADRRVGRCDRRFHQRPCHGKSALWSIERRARSNRHLRGAGTRTEGDLCERRQSWADRYGLDGRRDENRAGAPPATRPYGHSSRHCRSHCISALW